MTSLNKTIPAHHLRQEVFVSFSSGCPFTPQPYMLTIMFDFYLTADQEPYQILVSWVYICTKTKERMHH